MSENMKKRVLVSARDEITFKFTHEDGLLLEQKGGAGQPDKFIELADRDAVLGLALGLMRVFYQWVDFER